MENKKHIVIVGGGFAGLELVKELNRSDKNPIMIQESLKLLSTSFIPISGRLYGAIIYILSFSSFVAQI